MSTEQPKTPKPIKKTYTYFDLDKFEKVTEEREIPPFVPKTNDEVLAIVAADNEILSKSVNAYLKRAELRKIKLDVASKGGDTAIVMALAKPFRAMPPWNAMYELNPDGTVKVENGEKVIDRAAQTKSIFEFIKGNTALVASIKQATLDAAANEDEDDDKKEDEKE